jgi:hypothetical protein
MQQQKHRTGLRPQFLDINRSKVSFDDAALFWHRPGQKPSLAHDGRKPQAKKGHPGHKDQNERKAEDIAHRQEAISLTLFRQPRKKRGRASGPASSNREDAAP